MSKNRVVCQETGKFTQILSNQLKIANCRTAVFSRMGIRASKTQLTVLYRDGKIINKTNMQVTSSACKEWFKKPAQSINGFSRMGIRASRTQLTVLYGDGKIINKTNMQVTSSACKEWFKKPAQSINGHRFCEACISCEREDSWCTRCEEDGIAVKENCSNLDKANFFGDRQVVREMSKMKAKCCDCGFVGSCHDIKKTH